MGTGDGVGRVGLLHLLDRDLTALCGSPFGLITGSAARCTCPSCLSIWSNARDLAGSRPLAAGDPVIVSH